MQGDTSVLKLDTSLIIPNKYQPRKVFDEKSLNSLAESIKNYGIINPILVRKKEDKYEIIAGERRFRAAQKIGLTEVPVIVKNANEQQMAELALIENLERKDLNPIEEAESYEEIMKIGNQTQDSLAKKIGKSQSTIANKIRLLSLPIEVQNALSNQKISERHARSLLNVNDKERQISLLQRIINEKLTVKETESIINEKEITEKDIKQAIDDIMKSLNLIEEKEEKEDDNMNNGNFFPNFDNNNAINNSASLNMMNAQSMNQAPIAAAPEMVMPTTNVPVQDPQLEMTQQPMDFQPQMVEAAPQMNNNAIPAFGQFGEIPPIEPNFNNNEINPMNDTMNSQNLYMTQQPVEVQPQIIEPIMPESNLNINNEMNSIGQPMNLQNSFIPPQSMDVQPQIIEPIVPMQSEPMNSSMVDTPLFNPDVVMPSPILEQPQMVSPEISPANNTEFEVPVSLPQNFDIPTTQNIQTEFSSPSVDKLTELESFLSANGYTYKTFSNEISNCIIIEIPRN